MTETAETDAEQAIVEQVTTAWSAERLVAIQGGGTKAFYGNRVAAETVLDCSVHQGVVAYEPTELAITVRAGTPLAAVEALLAEHGQQFPFEPPHFGAAATIGGMVAAGLSGPRRPYAASVRDAVLGVRVLNGKGEVLEFGGRVMKNVAGYDLSRLMAGSLGVLGVLLEVSLKVMPVPPGRITLVQEQDQAGALELMQRWAGQALPISGTAWLEGRLHVRLAGSDEALTQTQRIIGGAPMAVAEADAFWLALREQELDCFAVDSLTGDGFAGDGFAGDGLAGERSLWRLSVRSATAAKAIPAPDLIEWGGALRWLRSERSAAEVREMARTAGGHATLFRAGSGRSAPRDGVFTPLNPVAARLHQHLKRAFDPAGIFNPGRLYPGMGRTAG
ncbi:glycolate oxidase subunit GlcE [Halochromatium glycolicum]|uniref:Glycolate oxidase subunit GlcE n=1 Tax=Halochromatium glycolicum TaxID=85075 RepID=A0AAJ0X910_9GAMM|nr:glycolate oxidase subunit GlcE [Halochromatium glycolicum]MBK1703192.1 glycolate oxidase subunit GlcE [Halochromatium glycolicum]